MAYVNRTLSLLLILAFILTGNGYSLPESKTTLRVQLQSSTEEGADRQRELTRAIRSIRDVGRLGKAWPASMPSRRLQLSGYALDGPQEIVNKCAVIITSDGLAIRPEAIPEEAVRKLQGNIRSILPVLKGFVQETGVQFIVITKGENVRNALQDTINPSRGADKGYINSREHEQMRKWLKWVDARNKKNRREDLEQRLGVKGEIEIYVVPGMYIATGKKDHYAIRDGVVYIDKNPSIRAYLGHVIFELKEILLFAERRWNSSGTLSKKEVRDRLVKWLDEDGDVGEIAMVLTDIHNRAPKLPEDRQIYELIANTDFSGKIKVAEILRNLLELCLRHRYSPLVLARSDREIWASIFQEVRSKTGAILEFDPNTHGGRVAALYAQLLKEAKEEGKDGKIKKLERFSIDEFKMILGILDRRITRPVRGSADEKSSHPVVEEHFNLPDGKTLVRNKETGECEIFGQKEKLVTLYIPGVRVGLNFVSVFPNGKIVTKGQDTKVRVWNKEGELLFELRERGVDVGRYSVMLFPDEKIITQDSDYNARLWAVTGILLTELDGKGVWVGYDSVKLLPNGDIETVDLDGEKRIWPVLALSQRIEDSVFAVPIRSITSTGL